MDKKLKVQLIIEAQKHLVDHPQNLAHDVTHHYRTWLNAKEIMSNIDEKFDFDVVEIICWWHDVRVPDLDYSTKRVCEVVAEYLSEKVEPDLQEIVFDSVSRHEFKSKPNYVEGKILQDADKLEILSEERFRMSLEAVQAGLLDKDYMLNASKEIYEKWFPIMPDLYNFEISKRMHHERLKGHEEKTKQFIRELEKL